MTIAAKDIEAKNTDLQTHLRQLGRVLVAY
jgi:hypothetical protein